MPKQYWMKIGVFCNPSNPPVANIIYAVLDIAEDSVENHLRYTRAVKLPIFLAVPIWCLLLLATVGQRQPMPTVHE